VSRNIKSVVDFVGRDSLSAYLVMMTIRLIEMKRVLKPTGSIFLHCNPTASYYLKIIMDTIFGLGNFTNEIIWFHPDTPGRPERYLPRKHDTILWYVKNEDHWTFNDSEVRVPILDASKVRYRTFRVLGGRKYIGGKSAEIGKIPEDVWQIPAVKQNSEEALGYPTQKPLALLERIINASSNKGILFLTPSVAWVLRSMRHRNLRETGSGLTLPI
jgi:adenine specific DNA methylase Mod